MKSGKSSSEELLTHIIEEYNNNIDQIKEMGLALSITFNDLETQYGGIESYSWRESKTLSQVIS